MVEANEGTYDLDIMIHHVRLVAEALAIEEKGAEVIAQMQRDAEKVATVVGKVDKPLRILALGWVEPDGSQMWGQGSGMTNDLVIRMAGGENILAEQGCCFHEVNPESLVAMAPDVIMVVDTFIEPLSETDPVAAFAALPGVADTPAGRNKAIYIVSEWLGYGATPMLPKAALGLAEFIETVKQ
jgi:iron complex transport system substrate-binding protein